MLLVRELLDSFDTVVWLDADAVLVDISHDMSALVGTVQPIGLVAHRYGGQVVPNLGVFVTRSSTFTKRLFEKLWAMDQYEEHKW